MPLRKKNSIMRAQNTRSLLGLPFSSKDDSHASRHQHSDSAPGITTSHVDSESGSPPSDALEQQPAKLKKRKSRLALLSAFVPSLKTSQLSQPDDNSRNSLSGPSSNHQHPQEPVFAPTLAPHSNSLKQWNWQQQQAQDQHQHSSGGGYPPPAPPPSKPPPQPPFSRPSSQQQHHPYYAFSPAYSHSYSPAMSSEDSLPARDPSYTPSPIDSSRGSRDPRYPARSPSPFTGTHSHQASIQSVSSRPSTVIYDNFEFDLPHNSTGHSTRNTSAATNYTPDQDSLSAPMDSYRAVPPPRSHPPQSGAHPGREITAPDASTRNYTAPRSGGGGSGELGFYPRSVSPSRDNYYNPARRTPPVRPPRPDAPVEPEQDRPQHRRMRGNSLDGMNIMVTDPRTRSTSANPPTTRQQPPMLAPTSAQSTAQASGPLVDMSHLRKPMGSSNSAPRIPDAGTWIVTDNEGQSYNTSYLTDGQRVPELWDDKTNVFVHVYPEESGFGPSFKVKTRVLKSSRIFVRQMKKQFKDYATAANIEDVPVFQGKRREYHVYIPGPPRPDLERLVTVRNTFAFLTGQALVATRAQPTLFAVFCNIGDMLSEFEFRSPDGKSPGEIPDLSFQWYMDQLDFDDLRTSHDKTLEALVLAEKMRSGKLYHEAFAHAVGKWAALQAHKSPIMETLSEGLVDRLERSHFELISRQDVLNKKLEQFDFPALFSGVAQSNSANKEANFTRWKSSFFKMRGFVQSYYRSVVGSWPPKASSKKNNFSESGLNRMVLKMLYADLCSLYELLVDREGLSTDVDMTAAEPDVSDEEDEDEDGTKAEAAVAAALAAAPDGVNRKTNVHYMRKLFTECDTAYPPVVPHIPFDTPRMPDMACVNGSFTDLGVKEQIAFAKGLSSNDHRLLLSGAYNSDADIQNSSFLDAFKQFEAKEAKSVVSGGKSLSEIVDQRIGYWIFLYAVIQTLPILVMDSPDLKHTEGVEYFLSMGPMDEHPWVEGRKNKQVWFKISEGGCVRLPPESVKQSIQMTFIRSHCWTVAKPWEEQYNYKKALLNPLPTVPADTIAEESGEDDGTNTTDAANTTATDGLTVGDADAKERKQAHRLTISIIPDPADSASTSLNPSPNLAATTPTGDPSPIGSSPSASPNYALRNPSPTPINRAPNRANAQTKSTLALGIEELALPADRSSMMRPMSGMMIRSASAGNLLSVGMPRGTGNRDSTYSMYGNSNRMSTYSTYSTYSAMTNKEAEDAGSESTFDDILGKMERRERKARKWGLL